MRYIYTITDVFPILDVGQTRQKYQSISDTLIVTSIPKSNIQYVKINEQLLLNEIIKYNFPLKSVTFSDILTFTETFGPTKEYRFADTLELSSIGELFGFSDALSDTLEFTENIQLTSLSRSFIISDVLTFREVIYNNLFRGDKGMPVDTDISVIDPGISNAPPDPLVPCYPLERPTITFSGSGSISLPRPEFGNKDEMNVARVNIRSRGNELIVFAPDYWPKDKVIDFDFHIYQAATVRNLQIFIDKNLGKMVTLTDHEYNRFTGVILTGSLDVKQHNVCHYTTSLSFQKFEV